MKQFFTLLVLAFATLTADAQTGVIYRLQGTLGGDVFVTSNSTDDVANAFRRSAIWRVVSSTNPSYVVGQNYAPLTGATLQIYGINLEISTAIDLSAYNFTILVRSEFRDVNGTTPRMHRGRFRLNGANGTGSRVLRFGSASSITLGWGLGTNAGTTYYCPGTLRIENIGSIRFGPVATELILAQRTSNGNSRLNAIAGTTTDRSGTTFNLATSDADDNSAMIRTNANAPTVNMRNRTAVDPRTLPPSNQALQFAGFPMFYTATAPAPGGTAVAPLPVQLTSFNAAKANGRVVLNWATAQELNSDYYEVQRSTDAATWTTITTVQAAGNSSSVLNYKAEDAAAASGNVYYRLKMVDNDATFAYSNIARLSFTSVNGKLFAYPNPATNYTVISSDKNLMGKVTVDIIHSITGVRVMQQVVTNPGNAFRINTNQLTPGNYIVRVSNEEGGADILKLTKF